MSATDKTSDVEPELERITFSFGNANPQMQVAFPAGAGRAAESASVPAEHLNQTVTSGAFWAGIADEEAVEAALSTNNDRMLSMIGRSLPAEHRKYALAINEMEQIVGVHTPNQQPTWVDSSDPELAKALGEYFDCSVGEPLALLTTVGRDALHAQHLSVGSQPAAFGWMALTASTAAPAAGDTSLTGEITTAGGGLVRQSATYAHSAGTNTSTLTKTFTANGSDALPVTIAQIGIFNASSGGTLGYHTALSSTATLSASGDNVTVTWTDTAG